METIIQQAIKAHRKKDLKEAEKLYREIIKTEPKQPDANHNLGVLAIGEVAVIIAVATPHRKAAFKACEYCIDTLKETVPIWKREFFEDGDVWVAAHP